MNKVNGFSRGLRVGLVGELPTIMAGLAQVDFVIVRVYLICDILFSNLWILCKKMGYKIVSMSSSLCREYKLLNLRILLVETYFRNNRYCLL